MDEPEIIGYGRECYITRYRPEIYAPEFKASLNRAFVSGRADFIILDSNMRGQGFLAACAAWAIDQKWLYNDRNQDNGQCKVSSFRLTEAGKRAILG